MPIIGNAEVEYTVPRPACRKGESPLFRRVECAVGNRGQDNRIALPAVFIYVFPPGSNIQAVINACKSGRLKARPRPVIHNNGNS
jgi:hypothetical protein